jgi:hypothetical protein
VQSHGWPSFVLPLVPQVVSLSTALGRQRPLLRDREAPGDTKTHQPKNQWERGGGGLREGDSARQACNGESQWTAGLVVLVFGTCHPHVHAADPDSFDSLSMMQQATAAVPASTSGASICQYARPGCHTKQCLGCAHHLAADLVRSLAHVYGVQGEIRKSGADLYRISE